MEERNDVPRPPGWTDLEYLKLKLAIREEVARQLARLMHDPATLCRLLLLSLESTDLVDGLEMAD
jgi:hypothetical protein